MEITIIGGGNIGKLFGALLTESGSDVTIVDTMKDLVKAVEEKGVTVETSDETSKNIRVKITYDINKIHRSDLVIVAVKGYSTRAAMENAKGLIGNNTYVLSVQNGAGNLETISDVLRNDSRIIGGVFKCVISPVSLNHILYVTGTGGLNIGPMNGVMHPFINEVAGLFRGIGIQVDLSENVQEAIWNKIILNSPLAMAAVLRFSNDEFISYPSSCELVRLAAEEAIQVARAKGFNPFGHDDPMKPLMDTLEEFRASGKSPKSSMLQDMEAGRRTEIDSITGSIVREGKRLNVPTPVNNALLLLVKAIEEKRFKSKT